jgi:hypothetical protein
MMKQEHLLEFPTHQCFTELKKVFAKLHLEITLYDSDALTINGQGADSQGIYQLQAICVPKGKFNTLVTIIAVTVGDFTPPSMEIKSRIEVVFTELKRLLDPLGQGNYLDAPRSTKPTGYSAREGKMIMIGGLLIFLAGIAATVGSMVISERTGGLAFIFYGIIVYGLANFIRGLVQWLSNRKNVPPSL